MHFYLNDLGTRDHNELFQVIKRPDFFYAYINQGIGRDPQKLWAAASDYVCMADLAQQETPRKHWFKAIRTREDDLLAGCIILTDLKDGKKGKSAEIGFFVDSEFQNQKIGFTAAVNLINWAWKEVDLRALRATVDPENKPSIRLLNKLGLRRNPNNDVRAEDSIYADRDGNKRPRLELVAGPKALLRTVIDHPIIPTIPVLSGNKRPRDLRL